MDENSSHSSEAAPNVPSREELNAELLEVPPPPDQPNPLVPLELDHILTAAIGYVRGRRGGDLLAIILVGSGARRSLTPNSDLDLIALVAGQDEWHEIVRVADRLIEIRYRGHKAVEEELAYVARLPPLLRKGRVLFEHEAVGSKLVEKAQQWPMLSNVCWRMTVFSRASSSARARSASIRLRSVMSVRIETVPPSGVGAMSI